MVELYNLKWLIDFSYLNRLAFSTFTEVGPKSSNQDSRLGPVIEKATKLSIQDQIAQPQPFYLVKFNHQASPGLISKVVFQEEGFHCSHKHSTN